MDGATGAAGTVTKNLQKNIEDFSRVQDWMQLAEKDSRVYQAMRRRYMELKVILTASGINLTELDMIKK